MRKTKWLLDYVATHPDAVLTFKASNMVLTVHSNALYLSKAKACSQARGLFFCSNNLDDPPNSRAILIILQIIKAVMSLAAETELGALYINARKAIPLRHLLEEMGHKQPPTPIQTNNSTALGIITNNINHVAPKQWTCSSIGFVTAKHKTNSNTIGTPDQPIAPTTGQSITAQHITLKKVQKS
jgi:hypothetical protein